MPPQEIIDYIQQNLQIGTPQEVIVNNLLSAQWTQEQIGAAFAALGIELSAKKKNSTIWVDGYNNIIFNWKALIFLQIIPFFAPIYFIYLIVISVSRHDLKLFKDGFWELFLAGSILLLVGFGACVLIFSGMAF